MSKSEEKKDEEAGRRFMKYLDSLQRQLNNESTIASWNYSANLTDKNLKKQLEVQAKVAKKKKEYWVELKTYPWQTYEDEDLKRQFKLYSLIGEQALSEKQYDKFAKILADMQAVYGKAKICAYEDVLKCDLSLDPEITSIMAKSRDHNELRHVWVQWRNVCGRNVRKMYPEYVELSNGIAVLNGFNNNAEFWQDDFEDPQFAASIEKLWRQIQPLYLELHAYVRRQLRLKYGEHIVSYKGSIPAHLLGNMWAQSWGNIYDFTLPFPEEIEEDISEEMVAQGYTPLKMFKTAEDFFVSLNLSPMTDIFWEKSIIEKPDDGRDLVCHAAAYDFYDGDDFRIKQCTQVNQEDFRTVHHEMGHIQYYQQYKHLPVIFRNSANSGFHEAIGDVMALSFSTRKHLRKIGLIKEEKNNEKVAINNLYKMCLEKVAFIPFGYIMDLWRWDVFRGRITPKNYNAQWWKLRENYQGVKSPVQRTENDFDIGAKFHTVGDVPYIRYFVSYIIQFQFHRALCKLAGEYDPDDPKKPLHEGDIYKSEEAGAAIKKMMQMGKSRHWRDAMEALTGEREMDAGAVLEYFKPIYEFLKEENKKNGEYVGWESDMSMYSSCPCSM